VSAHGEHSYVFIMQRKKFKGNTSCITTQINGALCVSKLSEAIKSFL